MSENREEDKMTDEDEQADNDDDHSHDQAPKEKEKKEMEGVKSSSPVVYIALILASFFALGVYEVYIKLFLKRTYSAAKLHFVASIIIYDENYINYQI